MRLVKQGEGFVIDRIAMTMQATVPGISEATFYAWRKKFGGLQTRDVQRLKELEKENARLKRLLAEAELDKAILKEALSGN